MASRGPALRAHVALAAALLAICSVVALVSAADEFSVMKVKDLKAYIKKKGTDCLACSSKQDLIDRAMEVKDWPDTPAEAPKDEPSESELKDILDKMGSDKERMAKLRESLEKAGIDMSKLSDSKIFSAEELAKVFKKPPAGADEEEGAADDAAGDAAAAQGGDEAAKAGDKEEL